LSPWEKKKKSSKRLHGCVVYLLTLFRAQKKGVETEAKKETNETE